MIFLQYADLGFLGAGQKYAAERYAKDDRIGEIEILSFVHFILLIVVVIFAGGLLSVYLNPGIIFNNLDLNGWKLARQLTLIFLISSPLIIIQRFISAVYSIRIEDYVTQIIEICANIVKIISTFYFFGSGRYQLVEYIILIQCMNFLGVLVSATLARFRYKYDYIMVVKSFRFNLKLYHLTKKMAFTSIALTIAWLLYYEMDPIYVSKLYTPRVVALFAIGITMLSFSRSLLNAFFAPFQVRLNHLRGLNDEEGLSKLFFKLVGWSLPISIIPAISIFVLMKPLILTWIGTEYSESILISRILIINLCFAFLSVPISYLAMARERFRFLFLSSIMLPVIYFVTFFVLKSSYGFYSLPIAKIVTISLNLIFNLYMIKDILKESTGRFLISISKYMAVSLTFLAGLLYITEPLWNIHTLKNTSAFIQTVSIGVLCSLLSIMVYYLVNPTIRQDLVGMVSKIKVKGV